jgi:hypothetical protein
MSDQGSLPWIGATFTARLTNLGGVSASLPFLVFGDSNSQWGATALPLDLSFISMSGCSLYTDPMLIVGLVNLGGTATLSMHLPPYVGATAYVQGIVTDLTANPLGFVTSNACTMTIGVR